VPHLLRAPNANMVVTAWLMDDSDADQRLPHRRSPNVEVTSAELDALGVLQFKLDPFA
jgi:hypothetical protein